MRAGETGNWLSVLPSAMNGTELSPVEFRDALALCYGMTPRNLPEKCDGCGEEMSLTHALDCKHGRLVHQRHDDIRDELGHLAEMALSPSAVHDEPLIHYSQNSLPGDEVVLHENRGDLLIRGLWERGKEAIIDVQATNLESPSHRDRDPKKTLATLEKRKKTKYEKYCLDVRRSFSPFITSIDVLQGTIAQSVLQKLSIRLEKKCQRTYSVICGYVRARMSVATVRTTNRCLRGSRVPARLLSSKIQQWEDGLGLALFR